MNLRYLKHTCCFFFFRLPRCKRTLLPTQCIFLQIRHVVLNQEGLTILCNNLQILFFLLKLFLLDFSLLELWGFSVDVNCIVLGVVLKFCLLLFLDDLFQAQRLTVDGKLWLKRRGRVGERVRDVLGCLRMPAIRSVQFEVEIPSLVPLRVFQGYLPFGVVLGALRL